MNLFGSSIEDMEKQGMIEQISRINQYSAMTSSYFANEIAKINNRLDAIEKALAAANGVKS